MSAFRSSPWNRTEAPFPRDLCVHQFFEARVREQPKALAATEGSRRIGYAQLDADANRLATTLLARGIEPEERVGILAERSLEYLVGILAILKAGGAYLPLDPHQPDERIGYMRENGAARLVLAQRRFADRVAGELIPIEVAAAGAEFVRSPPAQTAPESLAYVIYTSGSTGRPKGVMVEHRSVVNLVQFYRDHFAIGPGDRVTQIQRPGFDGSVAEIWPALSWGASLHIPDERNYTQPQRLWQWLTQERITLCDVPTLLAEALFDEEPPPTSRLRMMVTGGDKLRRRPPRSFSCPVFDQYGPTENTVVTTLARVEPEGASGPLHVGRPIANHRVYILDADREPVPMGEVGELYVGGAGLARGYLGDASLTAERFVPDPFAQEPGARLYRTGDLARFLPEGNVEYLGRIDQQVKIRGFRVELGEIETRLAEHPAVRESLVQVVEREGGGKRLVAHYVPEGPAQPSAGELRAFLRERVPHYMVPARITPVPSWPTTPNGKIDRGALLRGFEAGTARDVLGPRNAVDERLARIFEEALGVAPVGITDDFFELGGQSLIAASIALRVERELAVDLPLALFFQAPTIAQISDHVRGERPIVTEPGLIPLTTRGSRRPLFVLPGLGGHVLAFRPLARALGPEQPCFGLQDPALEGRQAPCASVEEMAGHFLELVGTVDPRGPHRLLGYSLGGLVALEMGRQLQRLGTPPAFVGLLDTPAPGYPPKLPLLRRLRVHLSNAVGLSPRERRAYLVQRFENVRRRVRGERREGYEREIWDVLTPRMKEVLAAHRRAGERYHVVPYPGSIALFRASQDPDWPATSFEDPRMGWGGYVEGGIDVRYVPGAHLEVLGEDHVDQLAAELEAALGEP